MPSFIVGLSFYAFPASYHYKMPSFIVGLSYCIIPTTSLAVFLAFLAIAYSSESLGQLANILQTGKHGCAKGCGATSVAALLVWV
ncbi:hypothetical protein C1H76_3237 [Elsinoe australis]|uniref:Uncharacterized protein n=1 Tax=Elsinoe australis TaxID=40998 RepID=A0A4U7B0I1_9PEZI|nr:hypothetical protein C1H76_3237 [Elsinoe australis]